MKKRIIAAILLLVTVLSTFAGCANYAYADKASFGEYAKVDYEALMKKLHTIEIEEEEFGPDENRKDIVVEEIYNQLLSALNTPANKKTNTPMTSERDMVEYYYYSTYVVDGVTYFNYNMTTPANTIVAASASEHERELKSTIATTLYNDKFNFADGSVYSITKSLIDERITEDDVIVVSYTLKKTELVYDENNAPVYDDETDEQLTKTTYTNYAHVELKKGDALFDAIINDDNVVVLGAYKNNEDVIIGEDESKVYRNIVISHIVDKKPEALPIVPTAKTAEDQDVVAYTEDGLRKEITIPKDTEVTYHVYPVAHVSAPGVDADNGAELIIRYVLGDDITTSDLAVLGSEDYKVTIDGVETNVKALVEKLVDEYKQNGKHYEENDAAVKEAKDALDKEIEAAKKQNIKDAVTTLYNATKKDGDNTVRLADEILTHNGYSLTKEVTDKDGNVETKDKDKNDKIADLVELLTKFYTDGGKVKFSQLVDGGILTLYTYKDGSGVSAVSLVNDINDAFARTDYNSYTKSSPKIDVADKKARYEYAVDQAQNLAVTAIINNILACTKGEESVKSAIVADYKASETYATDFLSYDLIKTLLLKSDTTEANFITFVDDLSKYVYGTEKKEEFSANVTALINEFKKSASSAYENVGSVKDKKDIYNGIHTPGSTISTYAKELLVFKTADETKNALDALADVYIASHKSTVYVVANEDKDLKDNQKRVSADSNRATVLQLILDDIIGNEVDEANTTVIADILEKVQATENYKAYKAVLVKSTTDTSVEYNFTYKPGLKDSDKAQETDVVKELDAALKRSIAEKLKANKKADYNEAQTAAYETAVNTYVAKLLSGNHAENGQLSVVLAERYVDSKIDEKVSTYNSGIETKLAKAIYEIIVDESIVTIDHNHKNYPTELVDEFYKTVLETHEYTYYTGKSTVKTPGTPAGGVTPEMRAEYEKWIVIYNEVTDAMNTAKTGMSNAVTSYLTTLSTIYEMEDVIAKREYDKQTLTYFASESDAEKYYEAKNAQSEASSTKTAKNTALNNAKTALAQAEKYLETAKNEKIDFSEGLFTGIIAKNAAVKDAKASVKNAEAALATAQAEYNAAEEDLKTKTEDFEKAKEAIEKSFAKKGANDASKFVENQDKYNEAKEAYDDAYTEYKRAKSTYDSKHSGAKTAYNTKKTAYDNAKAAVDAAGENVTAEQNAALEKATEEMNKAKEALDAIVNPYNEKTEAYRNAAIEYSKASVEYYAYAGAVEANAQEDYDAAVAIIDDKKDDEGNVTEEGLKTLISKSESDTTGTTLTNLEAYATFEDYLVATLGYNYKAELRAEAQEMLDEQIRVYAVAKALQNGVVANGADVVIGEGEEQKTIHVDSYWKTLEGMEDTLKARYEHSLIHNDEDIKSGKIKRELRKYWRDLEKSTKSVFVTNKVYNQFKNDIGHSNYNYFKEQYGDNNLRMYLQFENLLTYLLSTDYQENKYALHDGEYTVKEENGALKYLFITYTTVPADAE